MSTQQRTFSEPDLTLLARGARTRMPSNYSAADLERIGSLRRGDQEEEELLQAVLRASILAAAASSPRNSHDDNMSMTSSPRSDACKKGEEIPFDPLDVGATPSFDEIFA